jgi:hypothetical protein
MRPWLAALAAASIVMSGVETRANDGAMTNIGIVFEKDADRSTVSARDFAPLVTPTGSLLTRVAQSGGPEIRAAEIVGTIVSFPLVRVDQGTTLHARMLFESSSEPSHARVLESQRISELQNLFARFLAAPAVDVQTLKERPASAEAATLIAGILDGAKAYAAGGPDILRIGGVTVRFSTLN